MAERVDDERVAELMEAYVAALQRGEAPDRDALLAKHADLADELRMALTALDFIGAASVEHEEGSADVRELGDFRIHREIGRGGMGVVYEAEQLSLGRRVALKVLAFAAVLDSRHLQRFKNEAQAAAHLHHTHIVPVYSVGSDRGVHYYAMQYIRGLTVAQMIDEMRTREGRDGTAAAQGAASSTTLAAVTAGQSSRTSGYCRSVARLGIQAAEALDHAHRQGVVHRDVKPANLIIDAEGHLWITDFGLASFTNNPGLTMTGDVVGTIRYMSPEQALARRVPIDHRTDTYSLGVTLYEFLTLEVAFPGEEAHQVIQAIALNEPKSARGVNSAVPVELETILRKAMAKSPDERYETAQGLADDLRRFLEHKPIQAKRPGLVRRTQKWVRRHGTLVWSGVAALVVVAAGLTVSTILVAKAYRAESAQRREVEQTLKLTLAALDEVYLREAGNPLPPDPETGLRLYEQLANRGGSSAEARIGAARAQWRLGRLLLRTGRLPDAEPTLGEAIERLDGLRAEFRDEIVVHLEAAEARADLGKLLVNLQRFDRARASYRAALVIQERYPGRLAFEVNAATVRTNLALLEQQLGNLPEAERGLRAAVASFEGVAARAPTSPHRYNVAESLSVLGNLLDQTDRREEALGAYRRATPILEDLVALHGESPLLRASLAHAHQRLAISLEALGRLEEAEVSLRGAVAHYRRVVSDFPGMAEYRERLAATGSSLGDLLKNTGRSKAAASLYREGLAQTERLLADSPGVPRYRRQLAGLCENLGVLLMDSGRRSEAKPYLDRSLALLEKLSATAPQPPVHRKDLANSHYNLFVWYHRGKRHDEAHKAIQQALPIRRALASEFPAVVEYRRVLAQTYVGLGATLGDLGHWSKALEAEGQAAEIQRRLVEESDAEHLLRFDLASTLQNLGETHRVRKHPKEALALYAEALTHLEELVEKHPEITRYRFVTAETHVNCVKLLWGSDPAGVDRALQRALPLYRDLVAQFPGNTTYADRLDKTLRCLVRLRFPAGDFEARIAYGRELLALRPGDEETCFRLAWICVGAERPDMHAEALALAKQAVESNPKGGSPRVVLALARYRAQDFDGAVSAYAQAEELGASIGPLSWLYQAMAHARLGRTEEARRWYQKAVEHMKKQPNDNQELLRVRAEAEELMKD